MRKGATLRILLPRTYTIPIHTLFYLGGPVLGADDWQSHAVEGIDRRVASATVAVPCSWKEPHPLYSFCSTTPISEKWARQLDWEDELMLEAATPGKIRGCLIFWLAKESFEHPRMDGNAYGIDTIGELGVWRARLGYQPEFRVVIGAEPEFPRLDLIKRDFEKKAPGRIFFHDSLDATLNAAVIESSKAKRVGGYNPCG
jgi:hypothetical protein